MPWQHWLGITAQQEHKIIPVFFSPFSLFSGNHSGSDWSHHGQPHLLHMPCSHLQKDPEEWHHRSGDSQNQHFLHHLLSDNMFIHCFGPVVRLSFSLSCSWCFGWVWASCWSAPSPPSQFHPEAPASRSKLLPLQHLTGTTRCYQTSLNCTVKITTCGNGGQSLIYLMECRLKWFTNDPWKHLPQRAGARLVCRVWEWTAVLRVIISCKRHRQHRRHVYFLFYFQSRGLQRPKMAT